MKDEVVKCRTCDRQIGFEAAWREAFATCGAMRQALQFALSDSGLLPVTRDKITDALAFRYAAPASPATAVTKDDQGWFGVCEHGYSLLHKDCETCPEEAAPPSPAARLHCKCVGGGDAGHWAGEKGCTRAPAAHRLPCNCESVTDSHHGDCASNDPHGAPAAREATTKIEAALAKGRRARARFEGDCTALCSVCHRQLLYCDCTAREATTSKKWNGMCPANKHGLDFSEQTCDLCAPRVISAPNERAALEAVERAATAVTWRASRANLQSLTHALAALDAARAKRR